GSETPGASGAGAGAATSSGNPGAFDPE
ncbi:poly(hydroxyalcanoate) granule associated protein, partial [Xanthomonas oryzae pv. oryzae]